MEFRALPRKVIQVVNFNRPASNLVSYVCGNSTSCNFFISSFVSKYVTVLGSKSNDEEA